MGAVGLFFHRAYRSLAPAGNGRYLVLENKDLDVLIERVSGLMDEGWHPVGGVVVDVRGERHPTVSGPVKTTHYLQAVIRG